jgi:hypothetical protein
MWLKFSQGKYNYDENFTAVSKYVENNKISSYNGTNASNETLEINMP